MNHQSGMTTNNQDNPEQDFHEFSVSLSDLKIIKGARHCRIVNTEGDIIFRTTNLRDAEAYLSLVEENRRLHHLMEARGIAPHRIYLLEHGESDDEIVIVAKAGVDSVVIRHLNDGREEVVDLDDVMPIPEADYFTGSDRPVEEVVVSIRIDQDTEAAAIRVHRSSDEARGIRESWRRVSFENDKGSEVSASWSENGCLVFYDQVVIEE